jgi:hypothetical protein
MDAPESPHLETSHEIDPQKREIALDVYREAWKDFYNWEQKLSRQDILRLGKPYEEGVSNPPIESSRCSDQDFHIHLIDSQDTDTFTVEDYDDQGNCVQYTTISSFDLYQIKDKDKILPTPRYEVCTPASQNHGAATTLYDTMAAFIPYADDPDFPVMEYLEGFESFSWQEDFHDPDRKCFWLFVQCYYLQPQAS